jgi:predicted aspartyl protease
MTSRRAFLTRAALLATGGAALWLVRDRLPWPPLELSFADGRATPWMPLLGRGGLIEVDVAVNGTPIRAMIDSGAQFSAIDRALAEALDLPPILAAPLLAYGVSGDPALAHTVRLDLAMPGLAIPGLRAAALDLADLLAVTKRSFRLLIGRDVLRRAVVEADFPLRRARLLAPGAYRAPRDAIAVPLRMDRGEPLAIVQVEAAAPVEVLVDTGASGLLALSSQAAEQVGLLAPGRPAETAHSVSLGGLSVDRVTRARTVRIGGLTLSDVPVQVYSPAAHAPALSGLLGAGLFRRFRMALDLGEGRLFLVPPTPMVTALPSEQRR